jgi:hypothetical protein
MKKLNSAEEAQLSWESSTQLKKLNSPKEAQLLFNRKDLRLPNLTPVELTECPKNFGFQNSFWI